MRHSGNRTEKPGRKPRKWLYILAAIAMVVFVFGAMLFVKSMENNKKDEEITEKADESFFGVVASVSDNTFEIINTSNGKISFYTVGEDVVITKADGRKAAYTTIARGDIIEVGLSEETGEIITIDYTDEVWEKKGFKDLEIDTDKMTVSNGVSTYEYDKNTLFIYNGRTYQGRGYG